MKIKNLLCVVLVVFISSCTSLKNTQDGGISSAACRGHIITPPKALIEVHDDNLRESALGEQGKGMLCTGKVFEAKKSVIVYRVWDAAKPYTLYGGWWSLNKPKGPRDAYQKDNVICPEWSALDRVSQCTLKVGAHVVIGPGQSATCKTGGLPQSETNQVYVPNDGRNNILYVENCSPGAAWPQ